MQCGLRRISTAGAKKSAGKSGQYTENRYFKSNVRKNQRIKIDIVIKKLSAHFDVSLSFLNIIACQAAIMC